MYMTQKHGMPEQEKVSCIAIKKDFIKVYGVVERKLKALLKDLSKISLTYLRKSNNQKVESMALMAYFVGSNQRL